ncbi:MAG: tetratricopeptide repeat protein, partial [Cyclobacteriaceae bacterium]|nr:tetratricopeptide repeat protein [Cyclobacteriaceae bacterium]
AFQTEITKPVNGKEIIEKALELHSDKKYNEAIELYLTVLSSDSSYYRAMTELCISYISAEKYDDAINMSNWLMKKPTEHKPLLYTILGNATDLKDQTKEAISIYKEGIANYPYYQLLYYNLGTSYVKNNQFQEAVSSFQKAIKLNPFHSASHFLLGRLMADQGNRAKAMLSMSIAVAVAPTNNKMLVSINDLVSDADKDENSRERFTDNNEFDALDNLLRSKVALDSKYKTGVALDAPVVKQMHLLLDQFKYDPTSKDFWMQTYGPLIQELKDKELTVPFLYHILKSTTSKDVKKWISKNGKQLDVFYEVANSNLKTVRSKGEYIVGGKKDIYPMWYFTNNRFNAIGKESGDETKVGPWEFYNTLGNKDAIGTFNDKGEKIGNWSYYYDNGNLSGKEIFNSEGKLNGLCKYYYNSGQLRSVIPYKNGEVEKDVKTYYDCGSLREIIPFSGGKKEGNGEAYYASGGVSIKYSMKEGKLDGVYKKFDKKGMLTEEYIYNAGEINGPYTYYYPSGKIKEKGTYVNSEYEGEIYGFYENANKKVIGQYIAGSRSGTWEFFYEDEKRDQTESYVDGELDGELLIYDKNGEVYFVEVYESGKLKGYKFKNEGGELETVYSKTGTFEFKRFDEYGQLRTLGGIRLGKKHGDYTYYWPNGNIYYTIKLKNGKMDGTYTEYTKKGIKLLEYEYDKGNLNGYYKRFFENGKVEEEGWFVDDEREGKWITRYLNGMVDEIYHYNNGLQNGFEEYYTLSGKLRYKFWNDYDDLTEYIQYDTLGNVLNSQSRSRAVDTITYFYDNGKKSFETLVKCGERLSQKSFYKSGNTKRIVSTSDFVNSKVEYFTPFKKKEIAGSYKNNQMEGEWIWYYPSGKIETKGSYIAGERN